VRGAAAKASYLIKCAFYSKLLAKTIVHKEARCLESSVIPCILENRGRVAS
jgi:hypothetical protein